MIDLPIRTKVVMFFLENLLSSKNKMLISIEILSLVKTPNIAEFKPEV